MLTLELRLIAESRKSTTLRGTIRNVGTTRDPRLLCELPESAMTPRLAGAVDAPFAWTTPLPVLAEQAIAAALGRDRGRRIDVRKLIGTAEVSVLAAGTEAASHTCWRMYEDIEDERGFWEPLGRAAVTPWQFARSMLRRVAVGANYAPNARTTEAALPHYMASRQTYCRLSDLPDALRLRYEREHILMPQPAIKELPDAVYPHELANFLAVHGWTAAEGFDENGACGQPVNETVATQGSRPQHERTSCDP